MPPLDEIRPTTRALAVPQRLLGNDDHLRLSQALASSPSSTWPSASGPSSWRSCPTGGASRSAVSCGQLAADRGLSIWSAHGCWGGQTIAASRVDLGVHRPRRLERVGRRPEAVHRLARGRRRDAPGRPSRRPVVPRRCGRPARLPGRAACRLAEHAEGGRVIVCVENMPPGVHPGSRMQRPIRPARRARPPRPRPGARYRTRPHLVLARRRKPLAAGRLLATTHVHDNDGRQDTHDPPGTRDHRLGRTGPRARSDRLSGPSCSSASATSGRTPPVSAPRSSHPCCGISPRRTCKSKRS